MDLKLRPFDFNAALTRAGLGADGLPLSRTARPAVAEKGGFQSAMMQALNQVSQSQMKAEGLQREVSLDNPKVSIEETVLAMQKAQLGFQATVQVRNRLVQAYTDIMNMNV